MKSKLNLGCGRTAKKGYLNVDIRNLPGVDLVIDVRDLKFEGECFTDIRMLDLIEHLSFIDGKRLLRKCFKWLKPKGNIIIHLPNIRYISSLLTLVDNHEALKWMFGSDGEGDTDHPLGYHKWGYSPNSIKRVLEAIGYEVVQMSSDCSNLGLHIICLKGEK